MLDFKIEGANRVQNTLRKFAHQFPDIVDNAMGPWAKRTRSALKARGYPKKNTKRWDGRWASDKQRRYVMWAIRTGVIKVPYRRTGSLASRWSAAKVKQAVWEIKNSAPYALYVIGPQADQHFIFHRRRWWVARSVLAREHLPQLREDIADEIQKEWLRGAINART